MGYFASRLHPVLCRKLTNNGTSSQWAVYLEQQKCLMRDKKVAREQLKATDVPCNSGAPKKLRVYVEVGNTSRIKIQSQLSSQTWVVKPGNAEIAPICVTLDVTSLVFDNFSEAFEAGLQKYSVWNTGWLAI